MSLKNGNAIGNGHWPFGYSEMHEVEMLVLTFILEGAGRDAVEVDVDWPGEERGNLGYGDFFFDFPNGAFERSFAFDMSAWDENAEFGVTSNKTVFEIFVDDEH